LSKILIAGLGNPGDKFKGTRHNIGFDIIDLVAQKHGLTFRTERSEPSYQLASWNKGGKKVLLIKPLTYMNRSGLAVSRLVHYYRIEPCNLLVVHDDIDLALGRLRFMRKGGHGGHNGVRSVIEQLGTNEFPRLRMGIGRPEGNIAVERYVLSKFSSEEQPVIDKVKDLAAEGIICFIESGIEVSMNRYNGCVVEA